MATLEPTVVYDTFWRFAAERHAIYERRMSGSPGPWTKDPILLRYRFTNAYRAADRVSQYLITEVQNGPGRSQDPREVFFRTILFKLFNKIETWWHIERECGAVSFGSTNLEDVDRALEELRIRTPIYSAAYIMPSPKLGGLRKHTNHLALVRLMMRERLAERLHQSAGLADVYEKLRAYPGVGRFLAFQYAIDINYSEMLRFDEGAFVVAGPGALDGISKCFGSTSGLTPEQVIMRVTERQHEEFSSRGINFKGLFGRPLQPIDCQNLFCEISKYSRVAHPEIPGLAGRTKIKQIYRTDPQPLAPPRFPAHWNLGIKPAFR